MADKRIKDLPAFSGTLPNSAVFAMETNAATQKVDLSELRAAIGTLGQKNIGANGTYEAANDGLYGYNKAVVNVPNTYVAGDEGKVVQNGALVAQTSLEVTENGTYNTTTKNEVIVDVAGGGGGGTSTLAKIGSSSTIETVSGDYGPMGDYTADYLTPVNGQTREDVQINEAQPYTIKVAFKIAALPVNRVAIFGALDATNAPMPAMFIEAGGTNVRYKFPYLFGQTTQYAEGVFDVDSGYTLPLNTEIQVKASYNNGGWGFLLDDGEEIFDIDVVGDTPISITGTPLIGANGAGTSAALAGESGAYINIDGCEVKQGTTKLWPGGAAALVPLTATANGIYLPQTGTDGFSIVTVDVPNAGALAKLGSSTEIVTVSGIYGPMGDAADDYINPVSSTTRQNVTVDTTQPFEIQMAFRLSALPETDTYILLGAMAEVPFPAFYLDKTVMDKTIIRGSFSQYGGGTLSATLSPENYVAPLDTDILVGFSYDGTDIKLWMNDGTQYETTFSNTSPYEENAAVFAFASSHNTHLFTPLASLSEATLNIDKCYIKQGSTYLWRAESGGVGRITQDQDGELMLSGTGNMVAEVPLNATQNFNYVPEEGYAYSSANVDVSSGSAIGIFSGSTMPSSSFGNDGDTYALVLPSNVTFLDYLEGDGNVYVDTGIYGTEKMDVYARVEYPSTAISNPDIMGCRGSTATTNAVVLYYASGSLIRFRKSLSSDNFVDIPYTSGENDIASITKTNYYSAIDLLSGQTVQSIATIQTGILTPHTMILFGTNKNGINYPSVARIYRLTLYSEGRVLGDYIPALNNDVACMYNAVTGQFMQNFGSGAFTYGNAIPTPENIVFIKRNGEWNVVRSEF